MRQGLYVGFTLPKTNPVHLKKGWKTTNDPVSFALGGGFGLHQFSGAKLLLRKFTRVCQPLYIHNESGCQLDLTT